MSELIAEARVLVTPDTTTFRALLTKQLATATAGVIAPVQVTPVITGQAATAAVASQEARLAAETARSTAQIEGATAAKQRAIATNARYARSLSGVTSGAASAGLSLIGLRGATLAATGPFLAGAAGAIALGKALQTATSFNSQIAVLGATTEASGQQLERAAQAAREFGRDITLPGVTAGDAAETITEFAKAGLSLNDSIAATRGGLQLAQAAQLSYADAVTLSANALNAFGLSGSQAVHVADTLANAANLAQGGIEDTALALRQAAGAAAVVGVSFEDTTALLTLLARNGLTGSDAGTALRTAFLRLVNPSKEAKEILEDLNVQLRDINGNVRPEVFADFARAQRDLTAAQQQANAAIVFGQDAFRAFGFLGREGAEGLAQVQAGLEKTGTAARIAQARMTGLRGAQENLSNQITDLGLTVGNFADGPLELVIDGFASYIGFVNQAITGTIEFGAALKDIVPPAPAGSGFLGDIAKDIFGFTNPITGIASPIGQIKRIGDLFRDESDEAEDDIKNGGVELRDAIETASRTAAQGAVSFGDQIVRGFTDAFGAIRRAVQQGLQAARTAALESTAGGAGQAAGLQEAFDQIIGSGGSQQQQLANLRRRAEVQSKIIEDAGVGAAGVLLQRRREARARLASISQQIVAIEEGIAADQKQAQDERARIQQQAADAADRALLDRQADARTAADQRITLAEDTPPLRDDIRRTVVLRNLITQQIAAVKAQVQDEGTKQDALRALRAARFVTVQELKSLREANQAQIAENREAALEQIADNLALRTQIAEARGDEDEIVKALNAEIANQRKRVAAAKRLGKGFLQEKLALEQMLQKRRELLEVAEEDTDVVGGTSLADLFQRAEQISNAAGNVGFTAQSLRALPPTVRIQSEVQERLDIVGDPAAAARAQQERSTQTLIQAIDRLTEALTGNTASGTPITRREQNQWRNLSQEQRFFYQRQAKQMVEQGLVG